jgi:5'-methylthioadenosine phosphorylase
MRETMIGVIGGSGLYQIDGLEGASWVKVGSPFGKPSDEVLVGRLAGMPIAFLPRHGRGHIHTPGSVPYRANIDALKRLGVTDLIAISAVGSLRDEFRPGDLVLIDQYIDRTFAREKSFFGPGLVGHVGFAHPTCPRLGDICETIARDIGIAVHRGGTYLAMEGPQFSTLAESQLYRHWGADVVGMTGMPEAKLAREAEICYASVAMITDYDCWHPDHAAVDVAQVVATLHANAGNARALIEALPALLDRSRAPCPHGCDRALDGAIMTAPALYDPDMVAALQAVAGRILGS